MGNIFISQKKIFFFYSQILQTNINSIFLNQILFKIIVDLFYFKSVIKF
jgi:hypothetical protein